MSFIEPADSILAIDIGNTRIGTAIWDEDGLHDTRRIEVASPETWRGAIESVWDITKGVRRRGIIIGSVNPRVTLEVQPLVEELTGQGAYLVRDDLPLPMTVNVEFPDQVGVDRVCAAAAAFDHIRGPCAVASFGTAITIDCVSGTGEFMGGTILPGLELSCRALHEFTAQLPRVKPTQPGAVFGRNTHDAINSGVVFGAVGAMREIVEGFATELGQWPQLVITGGNAGLIGRIATFVDSVVPDLTLMGIALTYRRASDQP